MPYLVGPKGQVVIAKEIRDRLGIDTGWTALQRLVGDHVELYFAPPPHRRSLKGSLAQEIQTRVPAGEAWEQARESAWRRQAERWHPEEAAPKPRARSESTS
jgi:hypothetical protein